MADETLGDEISRMLGNLHVPTIVAQRDVDAHRAKTPTPPLPPPPVVCSLCRQDVDRGAQAHYVRGTCLHLEHSACRDRLVRAGRTQCRECDGDDESQRVATACDAEARAAAMATLAYRRQKVRSRIYRHWHSRGATANAAAACSRVARRTRRER